MALNTYSDLASSIADWIHTDDLAPVINDFIRMAESRMNNELDVPELYTIGNVTVTSGTGNLPADFNKASSVSMNNQSLDFIDLDQATRYFNYGNGTPTNYTLFGNTIKVYPASDGTVSLSYMANISGLSNSNQTNAILSAYPDLYLHACLIYAGQYRQDVNMVQGMEGLYQADISRINVSNWSRSTGMDIYNL